MNCQLLLWSWKVAECSLVNNLIACKETYLANVSTGCCVLDKLSLYVIELSTCL